MNKKTPEEWLKDKNLILKGVAVGIEQVEKGSIGLSDMAYGVVCSLLEYKTDEEVYGELLDLCGTLETLEENTSHVGNATFVKLKEFIKNQKVI
jgi:hypothetical protein